MPAVFDATDEDLAAIMTFIRHVGDRRRWTMVGGLRRKPRHAEHVG